MNFENELPYEEGQEPTSNAEFETPAEVLEGSGEEAREGETEEEESVEPPTITSEEEPVEEEVGYRLRFIVDIVKIITLK